jgi:hypothetical protein
MRPCCGLWASVACEASGPQAAKTETQWDGAYMEARWRHPHGTDRARYGEHILPQLAMC